MYQKNFNAWPPGHPKEVPLPTSTVYSNFERSVARSPEDVAIIFYETAISYQELHQDVCRLATWMHNSAGISKGDRVGIFSQNCPQYVVALYAALRLGAVVVPINPMYVTEELAFIVQNSGLKLLFAANELHWAYLPLIHQQKVRVVGIQYRDYIRTQTALPVPEFVTHQDTPLELDGIRNFTSWYKAMSKGEVVDIQATDMSDLVLLPYTSGSTGNPKGCCHDNTSVQHALTGVYDWFNIRQGDVFLAVAPMFHVVGLQAGLNCSIAKGGTLIIVPRWDREVAAHAIHNYRVTVWPTVPTMVMDLIEMPDFERYDISSLRVMFGGGTSMPEAAAQKLIALTGVTFLEGYGMTETCCPATANPPHASKKGCAGVPVFNTDIVVVDPDTFELLPVGEVGEVLICGPQVMQGYWYNEESNHESFVTLEGRRFLRTGDLGKYDEDGYLFIVDRIKRMINASGYKVWPTQVEAMLMHHDAIKEVCVIASHDPKRGETVKALVVLRPDYLDVNAKQIMDWSRQHLAAYKIPRIVEFVESLPKSASGKVLWRELQEQEARNTAELV